MHIYEDQKNQAKCGKHREIQRGTPANHTNSLECGRVTGTFCQHVTLDIQFYKAEPGCLYLYHSLDASCVVLRKPEPERELCRCHYHGNYWCPILQFPPVSRNATCYISLRVCVFPGLYRLHSLSRVHSHRFCGLPGKQEDPPPQMVQNCPNILNIFHSLTLWFILPHTVFILTPTLWICFKVVTLWVFAGWMSASWSLKGKRFTSLGYRKRWVQLPPACSFSSKRVKTNV